MSDENFDFLAHYGVKGMKWGVRKRAKDRVKRANSNRLAKRSESLKRVSEGKGSIRDKAYALSTISSGKIIANKGFKNAAAEKASRLSDRNERVKSGKTTITDKLDAALFTTPIDVLRARKD